MTKAKHPPWDKQDGAPIILANPAGPNATPSFSEPLKRGQEAIGMIGGIEVVVVLADVLTATSAEGEIVEILDGFQDRQSLGELAVGDRVFIRREDMYSLNVDVEPAT